MAKNERKIQKQDTKQASTIIAVMSLIGLTTSFLAALYKNVDVPIYLYAIFGGGVLGTDNVLKFVRAIFRIDK